MRTAAILALMAAAARADVPKEEAVRGRTADQDAERFAGVWSIAELHFQGVPAPAMPQMRLEFKGDRLTVRDGGRTTEYVVRRNTAAGPPAIDFIGQAANEPSSFGIYAFEGDTLRLCLANAMKARPKSFGDKRSPDTILFVLKRVK